MIIFLAYCFHESNPFPKSPIPERKAMTIPMSSEEQEKAQYETKNLNHLGLVAGQFDSLGLVELIDRIIPQSDEKRTVSLGQAVKAMVVNGLGFANHTLYLMPDFYENKPVERLIGANIKAEDLNQHLLGRSLDAIHDFDVTRLYSILATSTVRQLDLPCLAAHVDTTSFHVDGKYNSKEDPGTAVTRDHQYHAEVWAWLLPGRH